MPGTVQGIWHNHDRSKGKTDRCPIALGVYFLSILVSYTSMFINFIYLWNSDSFHLSSKLLVTNLTTMSFMHVHDRLPYDSLKIGVKEPSVINAPEKIASMKSCLYTLVLMYWKSCLYHNQGSGEIGTNTSMFINFIYIWNFDSQLVGVGIDGVQPVGSRLLDM